MAGTSNNFLRKFFILQWKNLLLKYRHWILTVCEIIIPTLLFMGIVAIRVKGGEDITPTPRPAVVNDSVPYYLAYCETLFKHTTNGSLANRTLTFTNHPSPKGPPKMEEHNDVSQLAHDIMGRVEMVVAEVLWPICRSSLGILNLTDTGHGSLFIEYRDSEDDILKESEQYQANMDLYNGEFYGGVVFPPHFDYGPDDHIPDLHYIMRFEPEYSNLETNLVFPIFQLSGPGYAASTYDEIVKFQNLIDLAYIEIVTKQQQLLPNTALDLLRLPFMSSERIMPYPAYLENNVAIFLGFMLPMFTILSFCFIVPPLMKRIVHEKQTGVKELMKLMGLPSWMHWVSWFLNALLTSLITILIIVLLVCVEWKPETGRVFDYSDPFLIFIFFLMYAMPLILMLFAISTFFDSPNLALATGVIVHVLTFIGPSTSINDEVYMTMAFGSKLALAIMPNVGLWWGIKILSIEEGKGSGLQWNTLFDRPEPSDPMTMGVVWAMLLADMLIYGIIIWYVDAIFPGKYGVAKKWYFPFQMSYWLPGQIKDSTLDHARAAKDDHPSNDMMEDEPQGNPGIQVSNLMKIFRSLTGAPFTAVNGVSFSAFSGQITALLGHNGAGKTTTMSVLTGMYSMTSGQATIFGCDIVSQMDKIRQHLGLCPQHNMLFTDLNVREHLLFFGMLKGLSRKEANLAAMKYIKLLNLDTKTNELSSNLSGGMKRKVNLGIALIGDSKVVMLDEPTSGMDPEARRGIWDLLQAEKKNRTILLTTHFMEEADVLGDRILIMSAGQVKCSGSPMFLKRRFGNGYTLTMSRGPKCNVTATTEFIRNYIEHAELKGQASGELMFQLPNDQSHKFPELFGALNHDKDQLDVLNFGLSVTTMEDVFLKVGQMTEYTDVAFESIDLDLNDKDDLGSPSSSSSQISSSTRSLARKARLTGRALQRRELGGLLKKRVIYTWRRKILYIIMMLIPSLYGLICQIVVNDTKSPLAKFKPREFDLSNYPEPIVFVSGEKGNQEAQALAETFKTLIFSGAEIIETDNLTQTILQGGEANIAEYRGRYILAADFKTKPELCFDDDCPSIKSKILALDSVYNSVPNHARPLAKNLLSNTLLSYLERDSSQTHSITTGSHPLPLNLKWRFEILSQEFISPYVFAYGVALPQGMGVLIAAFVIFPLLERVSGAKQVQLMTGLHPGIFWLSNLLWDFLLYIVAMIIMMAIIFGLDQEQTFLAGEAAGVTLLLIGLFGLGSVPMAYVFSHTCESAASGFALLIILNVLSGAIGPTGVWILRFFGDYNDTIGLVIASDVIRYIFTLFPAFPMSRAIMALVQIQEKNNLCEVGIKRDTLTAWCTMFTNRPETLIPEANRNYAQCCEAPYVDPSIAICGQTFPFGPIEITAPPCHTKETVYTWSSLTGINIDLLILTANLVFYFGLLVALESGFLTKLNQAWQQFLARRHQKPSDENDPLDEDVAMEQHRMHSLLDQSSVQKDALMVHRLKKNYGGFTAVNGLSFGVHHGECFGLLGINGAGKTTTFKMLTGAEGVNEGQAFLLGKSLKYQRREFLQQIGYCPQFDSIIEVLTGQEMLELFAALRGIPKSQTEAEIQKWMRFLQIDIYKDRQCGRYSGGNKRKLNVAMALMGDPQVIFLDEPTSGVDPVARRKLWDVITSIQKNGQSVVLTSHSMEECEALCNRLAIMVNGQFQCLGQSTHLKNKFAQGYTILLKMNTKHLSDEDSQKSTDRAKHFLQSALSETSIKDEHKDYIHFHIGDTNTTWEQLFRVMEDLKSRLSDVEDYSVSQTTLEQVFLSFAKKQKTEDSADLERVSSS